MKNVDLKTYFYVDETLQRRIRSNSNTASSKSCCIESYVVFDALHESEVRFEKFGLVQEL